MLSKNRKAFLNYTGKVVKANNKYEFEMNDSPKISQFNYFNAYNPTFDNTFKKVFKQESILLCFLNDLLYPNENKIKKIQYIKTNFNGHIDKYSIDSIYLDMPCICFLDNKSDEKNKIIKNDKIIEDDDKEMKNVENISENGALTEIHDLVIDVEMQKIIDESPSERFIKYMSYLSANILNKKIIILVLLIKNNDNYSESNSKSAKINYTKKSIPKYKTIKEFDNNVIIEVDLNYCYYLIKNKKEIWITDKNNVLTNKGKEWIKFLTMQLWCSSFGEEMYTFPNLENLYFNQPEIKKALQILNVINPLTSKSILSEIEEMDKEKEISKLKKLNEDKDKSLQEKDKIINQLSQENTKYKNMLKSLGAKSQEKIEEKSLDDIDYYDDEDENDEDYIPEEGENDDNNDDLML